MRGKKAQIFALYLVMLTLFLCAFVVYLHYKKTGELANSLVSPEAVLKMEDDLQAFELREEQLLIRAGEDGKIYLQFGPEYVKKKFFEYLLQESRMQEFLFSNLVFEGNEIPSSAFLENSAKLAFFEKIYSFESHGANILVKRGNLSKRVYLKASDRNKITFAVDFEYNLNKEYAI